MKTRHLVLSIAAAGLLATCSQSGYRNLDYMFTTGLLDNYSQSMGDLTSSASGGDPYSQRILGSMYYWGEYVDQSEAKAIAWWSRAADKGDEEAQLYLDRVSAGEAVEGDLHASIGREYWADTNDWLDRQN